MSDYQLIIIGAGLSGLAAGIRAARFGKKTLIVDQHYRPGGLNSYYKFQGHLLETGLHAITNFAPPTRKKAPLNLLFRQLQLSRRDFPVREQLGSEIAFPAGSLHFANDPDLLQAEVERLFPACGEAFHQLRRAIAAHDPFASAPWRSARSFVASYLKEPLLENMLFLPLMLYGNAEENDMALSQFVIMFRAVFEEGLFRPEADMRAFLDLLVDQYEGFGGTIRYRAEVEKILIKNDRAYGIRLTDGSSYTAEALLSTAGLPETIRISGWQTPSATYSGKMSFTETISLLPNAVRSSIRQDRTLIFYSSSDQFSYRRPQTLQDSSWGVICFPDNFEGIPHKEFFPIRVTNPASYPLWRALDSETYAQEKTACRRAAVQASERYTGPYGQAIVHQDSFTPLTIERFTRKAEGAVYGSPIKIPDGKTPWSNLFIAGTDQGYLGIVGSMLSGISIVNRHLLD